MSMEITEELGVVRLPWIAGPCSDRTRDLVVSFTDFRADSEEAATRIANLGMELRETWPVLQGAVGLWLWGQARERRGGSVAIWDEPEDLRRFICWPVHSRIMSDWRGRLSIEAETWTVERFDADLVWARVVELIRSRSTQP